jgi:23S rRNA (adenine1618-N6)-methyltransferase
MVRIFNGNGESRFKRVVFYGRSRVRIYLCRKQPDMKLETIIEKNNLHPRNPHRFGYDFGALVKANPELKPFVSTNIHGIETIDFSNPEAVKMLNKALLSAFYTIANWDVPKNYLAPAVPGRADYIHYMADLLALSNDGNIPEGNNVTILDIGTGASCIYPIIGHSAYGWNFVGTDIDSNAISNAVKIIESNIALNDAISLQQQMESRYIFKDIILPEDKFAFTMCNPPFHASEAEALKGTMRKINNLQNKKAQNPTLNFGGQQSELWCKGGELAFITQMIYESAKYPNQCLWFTTLVSKSAHLPALYKILEKVNAAAVKTIDMGQGQKTSRILAWAFLSESQQKNWKF